MLLIENVEQFVGYLRVEKKYSENTCISYTNDLTAFTQYCEKVYELDVLSEINHLHIRSWIVDNMRQGISAVSINRKISSLRSFYKWLIKRDLLQNNPMLKISAPKMPKRLPVVIHDINIQKLVEKPLASADEEQDTHKMSRDLFIIILLYSTGIRRAELVSLKTSDFDLHRKEVRVVGKGNKVRSIPLTEMLINHIKEYMAVRLATEDNGSNALFLTDKGRPIYPRMVYEIVTRQLSSLTTLSKRSPHVLRHTFATHMLDNGADLNGIKEILGHASLAATQIYTHSSIQKLKDVYNKAHPGIQLKNGE